MLGGGFRSQDTQGCSSTTEPGHWRKLGGFLGVFWHWRHPGARRCWRMLEAPQDWGGAGTVPRSPPPGPSSAPPEVLLGPAEMGTSPMGPCPQPWGGGPRRNPGATPQRGGGVCWGRMGTGRKSDFLKSHQDKTRVRRHHHRWPEATRGWHRLGGGGLPGVPRPPPEDLGLAPGRLLPCGWCWTRWHWRLWAGRRHSGGGEDLAARKGGGRAGPKGSACAPPQPPLGFGYPPGSRRRYSTSPLCLCRPGGAGGSSS